MECLGRRRAVRVVAVVGEPSFQVSSRVRGVRPRDALELLRSRRGARTRSADGPPIARSAPQAVALGWNLVGATVLRE